MLDLVPVSNRERAARFYRWQDAQAHVLGRLLLRTGLQRLGYPVSWLDKIAEDAYGRPHFAHDALDFNISHSGDWVLCALSPADPLGVDIEAIREIDLNDFKRTMTPLQWEEIYQAPSPRDQFFSFWVLKESVIKADGRGLSIPLTELEIIDHKVPVAGKDWFPRTFELSDGYKCCLASLAPDTPFKLISLSLRDIPGVRQA